MIWQSSPEGAVYRCIIGGLWLESSLFVEKMDEGLGNEEKVLIVAAAAIILAITLICTMCLVVPGCCLHNYFINKGRRDSSDEMIILEIPKKKPCVKIKEKITPFYQSVGAQLNLDVEEKASSLTPPNVSTICLSSPTLTLSIHLSQERDATSLSRLSIHVIEGNNLPTRDYPQLPDYYVKLSILHRKWAISDELKIHEAQTRVVNSSVNPIFNQLFTFSAHQDDFKGWCLRVGVCDNDRYTRSREICHGRINIREVKSIFDEKALPLVMSLEPSTASLGQVLVSLSYLPTAQRLSVNVMKSDGLHWRIVCSSLESFCAAVRVYLLDQRGRIIKKKRLSGVKGTDCPSFIGSALLLAPPMLLETATILIQVYHQDKNVGLNDDDDDVNMNKRNVVGFTALGLSVDDDAGKSQWQRLLSNPRQVISQWHNLK